MSNVGGTIATFTTTEDFDLTRPCIVSVDPSSTGTLTVQVKAGAGWATIGTVPSGDARIVDAHLVTIRCVVVGSVTYEVR